MNRSFVVNIPVNVQYRFPSEHTRQCAILISQWTYPSMCNTDFPAWDKAAASTLCTKPARTCIVLILELHKHPRKGEKGGGVLLTCSINHHVKLWGKRVVWEVSHSSWPALVDGRIRKYPIGTRIVANEEEGGDFRCWRCADCSSAASHRCLRARARVTKVGSAIF